MSGKNQIATQFNWQSANPVTGFLPLNNQTLERGSVPSGVLTGAMASTNTIYSNIIEVGRMDNIGAEVTWTGTPTGVLSVLGSVSGINFYPLTFSPPLAQPSGSASGYLIDLNQYPFKYYMLKYVNTSGTGVLTVYNQYKDLN